MIYNKSQSQAEANETKLLGKIKGTNTIFFFNKKNKTWKQFKDFCFIISRIAGYLINGHGVSCVWGSPKAANILNQCHKSLYVFDSHKKCIKTSLILLIFFFMNIHAWTWSSFRLKKKKNTKLWYIIYTVIYFYINEIYNL